MASSLDPRLHRRFRALCCLCDRRRGGAQHTQDETSQSKGSVVTYRRRPVTVCERQRCLRVYGTENEEDNRRLMNTCFTRYHYQASCTPTMLGGRLVGDGGQVRKRRQITLGQLIGDCCEIQKSQWRQPSSGTPRDETFSLDKVPCRGYGLKLIGNYEAHYGRRTGSRSGMSWRQGS